MSAFALPPWAIAAVTILLVGYLLFQATLPSRIPGIPYKRTSASRPFGDLLDLLSYATRTKESLRFLSDRCVELNSPICQVFVRPFCKPWVIITDSRESQDILSRRTREFDRGEIFGSTFRTLVPHAGAGLLTTDQWRANRRLMADTMSPWFLRDVAGPHDYAGATSLVQLWKLKEALAQGRPFDMSPDVNEVMNDIIFAVTFGVSRGTIQAKMEALSQQDVDAVSSVDDEKIFPAGGRSPVYDDIHTVFCSPEIALKSPLGAWHLAFALKFYPKLRQAVKRKNQFVQQMLDDAWKKFSQPSRSEKDVSSAADLLIAREAAHSRKSGRKAKYDSPMVKDELFLFLLGGFDTVPITVKWGIKFLTKHQDVQAKLRHALRDSFKEAYMRGEPPSVAEIESTKVPYLDAFLEEFTRLSHTSMSNGRITTQDVEILGYHIPKGVEVWTMNVGPGQTGPPFEISESRRRSDGQSEDQKPHWTGDWDTNSLAEFIPERWLRKNEDGSLNFDPRAGPNHVFGAGPRGCFGRKLAMRSMRTLFVLVLWEFELKPLPEKMASFSAKDLLTHQPQHSYLRLESQPL